MRPLKDNCTSLLSARGGKDGSSTGEGESQPLNKATVLDRVHHQGRCIARASAFSEPQMLPPGCYGESSPEEAIGTALGSDETPENHLKGMHALTKNSMNQYLGTQ